MSESRHGGSCRSLVFSLLSGLYFGSLIARLFSFNGTDEVLVMQIGSALASDASTLAINVTPKKTGEQPTQKASRPEDYLTLSDVKMIQYVSGTNSLEDAELNPNAKALAVSLGTKRQNGYVQGDVSKNYFYSQLSETDAKMIESMTGTSTIIDAMAKGDYGVTELTMQIALDRGQGSLQGDVTKGYLQNIYNSETDQLAYVQETGQSALKASLAVPFEALTRAMDYLCASTSSGTNIKASA